MKISRKVCPFFSLIMQDGIDGPGQRSGFNFMSPSPYGIIYQQIVNSWKKRDYKSCWYDHDEMMVVINGGGLLLTASTIIKEAVPQRSTACALASVDEKTTTNNFRNIIRSMHGVEEYDESRVSKIQVHTIRAPSASTD